MSPGPSSQPKLPQNSKTKSKHGAVLGGYQSCDGSFTPTLLFLPHCISTYRNLPLLCSRARQPCPGPAPPSFSQVPDSWSQVLCDLQGQDLVPRAE